MQRLLLSHGIQSIKILLNSNSKKSEWIKFLSVKLHLAEMGGSGGFTNVIYPLPVFNEKHKEKLKAQKVYCFPSEIFFLNNL